MNRIDKIAISLIVISVSIAYFCQTDWLCVTNCTSQGYLWGYCKSICTWC